MTDPDGGGWFTYSTTEIPTGVWGAEVRTRPDAGYQVEAYLGEFTTVAGYPVTFDFRPETGEVRVEVTEPGTFSQDVALARWVDADTLAFPADVPVTLDGAPRPIAGDTFSLWSADEPFRWYTSQYPHPQGELRAGDSFLHRTDLRARTFTATEQAADPTLVGMIALDLPAGVYGADVAGERMIVTRSVWGGSVGRSTPAPRGTSPGRRSPASATPSPRVPVASSPPTPC